MNEPQAPVVASNELLALAAEIENRFYHSQDGNGGDIRRCENFCERCFLTEMIVTFIKEKANQRGLVVAHEKGAANDE